MICSRLAKSRLVNLVALIGVVAASFATPKLARAIVINIEYTDEGDPTPHPENPVWDQDGRILKAHFQAAKTIWERLLPGDEEYTFDFHWDNDIGVNTLGLTTEAGIDQYMEINPNHNWFADPTPLDNSEFDFSGQQLIYNQLSAGDKAAYFTGTAAAGHAGNAIHRRWIGDGTQRFESVRRKCQQRLRSIEHDRARDGPCAGNRRRRAGRLQHLSAPCWRAGKRVGVGRKRRRRSSGRQQHIAGLSDVR